MVLSEPAARFGESPDVIGWKVSGESALIEAKVSRADFLQDRKKPHRMPGMGVAHLRYFLCPRGLVSPEEVPDSWGLLEATAQQIRIRKQSIRHSFGAHKAVPYLVAELWKRTYTDPKQQVIHSPVDNLKRIAELETILAIERAKSPEEVRILEAELDALFDLPTPLQRSEGSYHLRYEPPHCHPSQRHPLEHKDCYDAPTVFQDRHC